MENSKTPSKYHLSVTFLDKKRPYLPYSKGAKQELFRPL